MIEQNSSFRGRLFGPSFAGGGVVAAGYRDGDTLVLQAGDRSLAVSLGQLSIEPAGFNLEQLRLSWQSPDGETVLFLEESREREVFLAQLPPAFAERIAGADNTRRRVVAGFRMAVLVYGAILVLPFLALAAFLMNTDRISDWVAGNVPISYEEKIGELVLAQARAQATLIETGPAYDAVKSIGSRLTSGSRYSYQWFVADSAEVNAFAAPGGIVVVHAGLIRKAGRAEELAGVLAHEVAHVEQRHSLRNLITNAGFGVGLSLVLGDWSGTVLGGWIARFSELKFSRDAERQADSEGLRLLVRSGIEPKHMAAFFGRLAEEESGAASTLSILATHPASKERMAAMREELSRLPIREVAPLEIDWQRVTMSLPERQTRKFIR